MLGRQQIAGVPTALSELFKNAHDAYARRVQADFLREEQLLVIRDDGTGMSREAFERRWLTLAGDSKVGASRASLAAPPPGMAPRPLLGEKGIGRLAVAIMGPVLVVLTRVSDTQSTTCALVHWGLFALPNLTLEDVLVPVANDQGPGGVRAATVNAMRDDLLDSLDQLAARKDISPTDLDRIVDELASLDLDPAGIEENLPGPSLEREGHGTQFFIWPTDEQVAASIDEPGQGQSAPPLQATLVGFSNTVLPNSGDAPMRALFLDHQAGKPEVERISGTNFFTSDEFAEADHLVSGTFDAYGSFSGTVRIYGADQPLRYSLPYVGNQGQELLCGPFRLELAILQPVSRESRLDAVSHVALSEKMSRIGGVYVYRDGIRVQPYGGPDVDWLDIERRRTMNAGRAFFSYRRMFGGVLVDYTVNESLQEKAGREGFRENRAFRQFRDVLQKFFVDIARDVFVKGGEHAEGYLEAKAVLDRNDRIRAERAEKTAKDQERLARVLDEKFARHDTDSLGRAVSAELSMLASRLASAETSEEVDNAEREARSALEELSGDLAIPRPSFGLTDTLRADFSAYQARVAEIHADIFEPAEMEIALSTDRRLRSVEDGPTAAQDLTCRNVNKASENARGVLSEATETSIERLRRTVVTHQAFGRDLAAHLERSLALIGQEARTAWAGSDEELAARTVALRARVHAALDTAIQRLGVAGEAIEQLEDMLTSDDPEGRAGLTSALEEELLAAVRRADDNVALAQIGMTVELVQHEINIVTEGIRQNLRRLSRWASGTPDLKPIYEGLRGDFDHLDSFLNVLAPLQRRLGRRRVTILGSEVLAWLRQTFELRLEANRVVLSATKDFATTEWVGFRSTFYPAFGNLVDNAVFWASPSREQNHTEIGQIELATRGHSLVVADTGPGIDSRIRDQVFELWWTRRTAGRGAGLYLTRAALAREGWTIEIASRPSLGGTDFLLSPPIAGEAEEGRDP